MKSLEELKEEIKEEASDNPRKFFSIEILEDKGFSRGKCNSCGMYFWSFNKDRNICGEPECGEGYQFINNSPTKEEYEHHESWTLFNEFMQERGYSSINRYPVVARWRDDVEFTGASIYCFQPYVVSGEAEPPAKELIIPQPSLRFNDIDNVGITGRHYTNFTMIGQTCFQDPQNYDQDRYFRDMFEFTEKTLGIPKERMIFHEEAWGGGGNLGPCMECFVDGLELWNQVYMFYERTENGYSELDLQVLDMGMGHERITWLSKGTETSYESVMPKTVQKLKEKTELEVNQEIWKKFLPHSSELNIDEVDDIEEKWKEVAEKIGVEKSKLKEEIQPAAALYSVAEHSRALNFALADGKIPSNTGGGHNLRIIYRRAEDFIEKYDWDIDMKEVAEWNARELEQIFPELIESIDEIKEIIEVEKRKYEKARKNAREKLSSLEEQPSREKMIELYESHGVSPKMMEERGFNVPEDFYSYVSEEDESINRIEEKFDVQDVKETKKLYYERREPYNSVENTENFTFKGKVLKIIDDWVILNKTMFYPEGGGQKCDIGKLNGHTVEDVQKQSGVVLHKVPDNNFEPDKKLKGVVNGSKRKQLTQHHSTTHMINAAAREELGNHIYQAGASKKLDKARLDITHYYNINRNELDRIEEKVRGYIEKNYTIKSLEMKKSDAEKKYGFRIYQGGAPPGNKIRLIEIENIDIEACGGTHLTKTGHAEDFVVTKSKRIQDGVVRVEYKAGEAARVYLSNIQRRVDDIANILGINNYSGESRELQRKMCEIYSTEPKHLVKTIKRFKNDIEDLNSKINLLSSFLNTEVELKTSNKNGLIDEAEYIFKLKKEREKKLDNLENGIEEFIEREIQETDSDKVNFEVPTENIGLLIRISKKLANKHGISITLIGKEGAVTAAENELDATKVLNQFGSKVSGNESFAKSFDLKD